MQDVSDLWANQFWDAYTDVNSGIAAELAFCRALAQKAPFGSPNPAGVAIRTEQEEVAFSALRAGLVSGFCIAGYFPPGRTPAAFEIVFDPLGPKPTPIQKQYGYWFWGAPNMIQRLIFGLDDGLKASIVNSGKWTGTLADLEALSEQHTLAHPIIPIRDAIDFVHSFIFSTINAFKFSTHSQICGGPIEVAVITTDRRFRWVRHKDLDAAIAEAERGRT